GLLQALQAAGEQGALRSDAIRAERAAHGGGGSSTAGRRDRSRHHPQPLPDRFRPLRPRSSPGASRCDDEELLRRALEEMNVGLHGSLEEVAARLQGLSESLSELQVTLIQDPPDEIALADGLSGVVDDLQGWIKGSLSELADGLEMSVVPS